MKKSRFILAAVFAIIFVMLFAFTASASENPVSLDGIQIRINAPYGIRYIATVEGATSDYDEVGMLVIPTEKLSGELTLDTPKVGKITSKSQDFRYFPNQTIISNIPFALSDLKTSITASNTLSAPTSYLQPTAANSRLCMPKHTKTTL